MERQGIFIAIEGSDGSGKATQLRLIKDRLEAAGHRVETFDFPQYDQPSSYFVKRYLEGGYGKADDVGPYTSSLFYALDRFEAAPRIRQALKEGKIVISNRFTGSNMAHQGTKMSNAEQRRGFFIWLDNLEFEMLRIPRPTISFVLRVPAEISQSLIAGRQKDIHEADALHLERTVAVYDDMVQLFPKDFQRIDCLRSGRLLDIETVNNMLWEKITPLLPEPVAQPAPQKQATPNPPSVSEPADKPQATAPSAPAELVLENASALLTQKVERILQGARLEHPEIPSIYTPLNLVPEARREYEASMSTLLGLYAKIIAGLAKRGVSSTEARQVAGLALPLAAGATVHIDSSDPQLEELIISLLNDPLPEAQAAGAQLLGQAIKAGRQQFKNEPIKRTATAAVKALAEEFLVENHIGDPLPVQLVGVWPRNELALVADMLYEHTNLPLRTIQERIDRWPMGRKLAVFEAYVGDDHPGAALEKAHYTWDLFSSYAAFRELQTTSAEGLATQPLTPRYGYGIPALIEEADLSDSFEKCGDLSLKLYSALQQAGHLAEAQYATLHAHKQRWQLALNGQQIITLVKHPATELTAGLLGQMHEILSQTHAIIGETAKQ